MADNLENIRSKSRDARLRLEGKLGIAAEQDSDSSLRRLTGLFSSAQEAREQMLARFSDLISLRVEAYEAAISGYVSSYYAWEISRNVAEIDVLFRVAEIFSSGEFSRNFDAAVYVLENSYDQATLSSIAAYFGSKFEEVAGIAFPDVSVEYTYDSGLEVAGSPVASPEDEESKVYLALSVLGKLKEIASGSDDAVEDVSALKEFVVGPSDTSFVSIIRSNIGSRVESVSDMVLSKRFMDEFRSERDPSYKPEADSEVSSKMSSLLESARAFSDLIGEKAELAREGGVYDGMVSLSNEILSVSDDTMSLAIDAIEEMELFLEDYQPFVRLPKSENEAIGNAIAVCEQASLFSQEYQDKFGFGSFFSPFRTASLSPSDTEMAAKLPFSEWKSRATEGRRFNGSNFDLSLLYMGTQGRGFVRQGTYLRASNYVMSSAIRKGLVKPSQLVDSYRSNLSVSSTLTSESGVRVAPRPSEERTPFALKAALPGLEALDYIDFSPALMFSSSTPEASEVDLRNNVRLMILEELGRVRKESLAETIRSIVSALVSYRRENLRGLYTEICFREALELMDDYLDGLDAPTEETRIDSNTRSQMQSYLSRLFRSSETQEQTLERWLSQYIASHAALYGSGSSGDLLGDALIGGAGTLREFLLG